MLIALRLFISGLQALLNKRAMLIALVLGYFIRKKRLATVKVKV
jgi:hypothetical protein